MTGSRPLPLWRSLLFVPVNVDRFVDRAHERAVDAVQLDLEDSVPEAEKAAARHRVQAAAAKVARGGADVVVRINRPLSHDVQDIAASVSPLVAALAVPKVSGPDHLRLLGEVIAEAEQRQGMAEGATRLIAMVETADAWFRLREIAGADPRLVAITLGSEDFAASAGMLPNFETLYGPKQAVVLAAAAAGILPLGFVGSIAEFRDLEGLRRIVRRSRDLGFRGASCIHPAQAQICNEEFAPRAEEVAAAERIVEAYRVATAAGSGAIVVDDRMVDVPVVDRARALLAWQAQIAARAARRGG